MGNMISDSQADTAVSGHTRGWNEVDTPVENMGAPMRHEITAPLAPQVEAGASLSELIAKWHEQARTHNGAPVYPDNHDEWSATRREIWHAIRARSTRGYDRERGVSLGGLVYIPKDDGRLLCETFDPID